MAPRRMYGFELPSQLCQHPLPQGFVPTTSRVSVGNENVQNHLAGNVKIWRQLSCLWVLHDAQLVRVISQHTYSNTRISECGTSCRACPPLVTELRNCLDLLSKQPRHVPTIQDHDEFNSLSTNRILGNWQLSRIHAALRTPPTNRRIPVIRTPSRDLQVLSIL